MNKKIICLLIVTCFIIVPVNQCTYNPDSLNNSPSLVNEPIDHSVDNTDSLDGTPSLVNEPVNQSTDEPEPFQEKPLLVYGFVLPNIRLENKTLENQIFCKIRHLVNDLLREDISVYWIASNITVNISEVIIDEELEMFFEKGSFVVPFTGDDFIDTKIVAIVCDYNQTSEIEENNAGVPVYLLMQQVDTLGRGLSNVKIANYISVLSCGESWFADVAYKCGFLDFEFIKNKDFRKQLINDNYNLLIWPGYDMYYDRWSYALLEIILGLSSGRNRAIRKFVSNGGGFVGSCWAVDMAARGAKSLLVNPSIVAQNPNLPSVVFLSISDIIAADGGDRPLEQQILDVNHPVAYGVDKYLTNGVGPGPMIAYVGESVDIIAEFKNNTKLGDTPSIVSNNFGDGKVVLFSPHPEVSDPDLGPKFWRRNTQGASNNKKLVTNAFYYATAQEEAELGASEPRNVSFIYDIWNETVDLSDLLNEQEEVFEEIKADIDESIEDVVEINNQIYSILNKIEQIGIEQNIDPVEIKNILSYVPTEYLLYCFDLIKVYLENTTATLETIEKIYPLLKDDTDFIEQIEQLKNDLSCKMDEMQEILSTSSEKLQKMEDLLESYRQHELLRKKIAEKFENISHDVEIQTKYIFQLMPGGYFNSLKLLRHYWYDYEVSIVEN